MTRCRVAAVKVNRLKAMTTAFEGGNSVIQTGDERVTPVILIGPAEHCS
jgi:hypothetical protein